MDTPLICSYGCIKIVDHFDFVCTVHVLIVLQSAITLRGMNTLSRESTLKIVCSILKGVYSERKAFAPFGSKCFPFRVDPFQKELYVQEREKEVTKVMPLVYNGRKSTKCTQSP